MDNAPIQEKPKILITGGAGFIGSHLATLFRNSGFDVSIFDSLNYAADLKRLPKDLANDLMPIDINDKDVLHFGFKKLLSEYKLPNIIIHMAAQTHVDKSIQEASDFIKTNISGTYNMIHFSLACQSERFVYVSTDEVYGEKSVGEFSEDFPLRPRNPYAATKASAEHLVRAYGNSEKLPYIILRPCNNYGPTQNSEKFIPKSITGKSIDVYGEGLEVREWIYVEDCARAMARAALDGEIGEVYNIGSGYEISNLELARKIAAITKKPIRFVANRKGHDFRYKLNSTKMRSLWWEPLVDFDQGLAATVNSYLFRESA